MSVSDHVAADSVISIAGTSYTISIPRIKEMIELVNFLKDKVIARAKKDCQGLDIEVQKDIISKAREYANNIELVSQEFLKEVDTLEGHAYCFYLLLKRNHANVSPEQALGLYELSQKEITEKVVEALKKSLGLNPTTAAESPPSP